MEPEVVDNPQKPAKEEELLELAKKELLRDVKCASMRAEQFGAHSWAKPQHYVPSKRFLKHMLVSASRDNRRREQHSLERREKAMRRNANYSDWHSYSVIEKKKRDYYTENEINNSKRKKSENKNLKLPLKVEKRNQEKEYPKSSKEKHRSERS